MNTKSEYIDDLLLRLRDGEVAALARAISLVDSNAEVGNALHHAARNFSGEAEVYKPATWVTD